MSIERYGENGEIFYADDGGPLKNLWKYMAIINNESGGLSEEKIKFDYNDFFKRLYLSRAELDVSNSVLELILKEGGNESEAGNYNILIGAVRHENNLSHLGDYGIENYTSLRVKFELLKEIIE